MRILRHKLAWATAVALASLAIIARFAISAPEPSVGLIWYEAVDPTAGGGICAPQWQLLVRTDSPSIYAHTGTGCTSWTKLGTGTAGGGSVTSITCGTGLSCTPANPIVAAGTIAVDGTSPSGTGTGNTIAKWTGASTLGNSSVTDDGTTITLTKAVSLSQSLFGTATISPVAIPGPITVNDYAPTGFATAFVLRQDATGGASSLVTITGLAGGAAGRMVVIENISSDSTPIGLAPLNGGSAAANQFSSVNTNTARITPGGQALLWYDGTTTKWRILAVVSDYTISTNAQQFSTAGLLSAAASNLATTVSFTSAISPTALSGSTDNYAPTNIGTNTTIHQDVSSAATLTGLLSSVTNGSTSGRLLFLEDIATTAGDTLTLVNESASSTAANRFRLPGGLNYTLQPGDGITLRYDATVSRWRLEGTASNPAAHSSPIFATGFDGAQTFDGTTTILGIVPSGSVYTLPRAIWCSSCTVNTGVEIKEAGFPFFDNGILTLSGTGKIDDNGNSATAGAAGTARSAAWFGANAAGGAGGAPGAAGGASSSALCNPFVTTIATGGAGAIGGAGSTGGTCAGGSGGGAAATNTGGNWGGLTAIANTSCGDLVFSLQHARLGPTLGTALSYGSGGGGGGNGGGTGGGGGASGGNAFVAARILAGSGTIEAKGGNGANGASGGGGGGGGAGGYVTMIYESNQGTVAGSAVGGTHGTGNAGGGNGGDGGTCLVFRYNLSGDGT